MKTPLFRKMPEALKLVEIIYDPYIFFQFFRTGRLEDTRVLENSVFLYYAAGIRVKELNLID